MYENGLITLFIALFGIGGYALGFYYGKRNYKLSFSPEERNIVTIEVETQVAQARLRLLRKEIALVNDEIQRMRKIV
jgi:hypothetical protein